MSGPAIAVVGSVNLDFVATAATLPAPGETVTGASLARHPGGKGANQALAARRLGADVRLIGRVGKDAMAEEALQLLRDGGVDLTGCSADPYAPTGVALIAVGAGGENQIIVAPGANAAVRPEHLLCAIEVALIVQLELPVAVVLAAVQQAKGFVCANLAPAMDVSDALLERADLIVVNEVEAAFYGDRLSTIPGLVALTRGSCGARLLQQGRVVAEAVPPKVEAVDSTGAGDAFVAALTVALLEGQTHHEALRFACTAGALAAMKPGAQPSLPLRAEVDAQLRTA